MSLCRVFRDIVLVKLGCFFLLIGELGFEFVVVYWVDVYIVVFGV